MPMIFHSRPIRRILRDPVRTVYRLQMPRQYQIIRPFVPLSKIVYRYNVMQASRANRTCCGSTKRGQHTVPRWFSQPRLMRRGNSQKEKQSWPSELSTSGNLRNALCGFLSQKKTRCLRKELLALHTKFRENLIGRGHYD